MFKNLNLNVNRLILLLLFFIQINLISQTGWYPLESGTNNILKSVYFVNTYTGYMSGDGIMLKTMNGGNNWLVVSNTFGGSSLQFVTSDYGFVCDGTIYKTTNGGINWQNLNMTQLNSLYFLDENTGYVVGKNSQVLKTTNGGSTWTEQTTGGLFYNKHEAVLFLNQNVGFLVGGRQNVPYYGMIYKTTNGGNVWNLVQQSEDIDFRSISFVNDNTGFAVGGSEYASSGVIYKTTNAGETWTQQGIVNKDLNSICFSSVNTGYAVGEGGIILKTTDGSVVWNTQVSNTNRDLNAVYFVRENLGYTVGGSGLAQKTINGGVHGPPFGIAGKVILPGGQLITRGIVKALKYNEQTNTVEVLDQTTIQTDGTFLLPNVSQDSTDIMAFPDDEDADMPYPPKFVPTFYTSNGNPTINWYNSSTLYPTGNVFNVNITVFPTTGTGGPRIIGGGVYTAPPNINALPGSIVYAMVGNEFKGYSVSRTGGIYDVNNLAAGNYTMICDRFGYRSATRNVTLGGNDLDTINFYMVGIGVIGIQPNGQNIPVSYNLEQNYPNPFNPVTNFKVDLPKTSAVKISVFDMLGREIEVLVNSELKAGSYKVSWDASKYSSGIYFYRIASNEFNATKKMMLVK